MTEKAAACLFYVQSGCSKIKSIWKQKEFFKQERHLNLEVQKGSMAKIGGLLRGILVFILDQTRSFRFWRKLKGDEYLIRNEKSCCTYAWGVLWRRLAMALSGSLWQSSKKPLHKLNNFQMIKIAVWFSGCSLDCKICRKSHQRLFALYLRMSALLHWWSGSGASSYVEFSERAEA